MQKQKKVSFRSPLKKPQQQMICDKNINDKQNVIREI